MIYKTKWTKPSEVKREWYVVDVKDQVLGRVATKIASLLIGKEKPEIVPDVDCGDNVIVINSDNVKLTRGKELNKMYYRHSMYPGGFKETTWQRQMEKDSTKIITDAVKNMLPNNKSRDARIARLYVYKNSVHKHGGQNPIEIKFN